MKAIVLLLTAVFSLIGSMRSMGQEISLKSEFFRNSGYYYLPPGEKPSERIGDAKGSAAVVHASFSMPFSVRAEEGRRPTIWGIGIGGSYTSLNNQNFTDYMVSEILDLQAGVFHKRPINDKWSLRASLGVGIFSPTADLSKVRLRNVLGSAGLVFICHIRPNLSVGGGLALNSSLGYPMVFPAVYLNWDLNGKFDISAELIDGLDIAGGYEFNDWFKLSYALEMNGQVAMVKKDGKNMIFSHQYIVTGFRPEIKLRKSGVSVIAMAGLNLYRPASFSERSLKGIIAGDNDYYFSVSPYVSVGVKYNIGK